MKRLAAIFFIILSASSPLHAEYDSQHTVLALNMAIVSVNRILTAGSRAVLEQEYSSIINNLSLGNIESDSDMTALYRDLLSVISRKRVSDNDSKRLKSFYDKAEQRRIAYALSNVKITEAQISAMKNDIEGLGNESQTQISAARNDIESLKTESQARISLAQRNIADVKQESLANLKASQNNLDDIHRINREKNYVTYSWLGNMALSCVSFFVGDVFAVGKTPSAGKR